MLVAIVFGKESCGLCKKALEKLTLLRTEFVKVDLDRCMQEGWPALPAIELPELRGMLTDAMAMYQLHETLPWISLYDLETGEWEVSNYPETVRKIREWQAGRGKGGSGKYGILGPAGGCNGVDSGPI